MALASKASLQVHNTEVKLCDSRCAYCCGKHLQLPTSDGKDSLSSLSHAFLAVHPTCTCDKKASICLLYPEAYVELT